MSPTGNHGRAWVMSFLVLVCALVLPQCLLLPERGFVGTESGNQKPVARVTQGVLLDSTDVGAQVHFYWFGADNDGVVRWFEWAIDDTVLESDWHRTERFDAVIPFQAADAAGGNQFHQWHRFFLRAVDDDNSRSVADERYFNSVTIAPQTEIVNPVPSATARWASTLRITWRGEDPDGSRADRLPEWFEYKQVLFPGAVDPGNLDAIRRVFRDSTNQFYSALNRNDFPAEGDYYQQARRAWVRVPASTNSVWLREMLVGRKYGFAVRAIDEAGAVEPQLDWDNWAIFEVQNKNVEVYLSEPSLGVLRFNSKAYDTWEVSVAPEQMIRFRWVGDATASGSQPGPSNYGFDVPDPEDPLEPDRAIDGRGGWIGWGERSLMIAPVSFPREDEGVTHHFYLKMRDISGMSETETRCHVAITVARLSFIRKFLLVDDVRYAPRGCASSNKPSDEVSDAYVDRIMATIDDYLPPAEERGGFDVFGRGDSEARAVIPDAFLDTLGLYQTVIWVTGSSDNTGFTIAGRSGDLARYRGAGGNLLLLCYEGPVTGITKFFPANSEDPKCAYEGLSVTEIWTRFSFLYQALHLTGCVDKPRNNIDQTTLDRNSLVSAEDPTGRYPTLWLDWTSWGCTARGVWQYEALWPNTNDPSEIPWYDLEPGLEVLYRGRTLRNGASLDRLPVAWRTFATQQDSLSGTYPGRVVVFAFHPFFFQEASVTSAMSLALQWLVTGSDFN